MEVARNPYTLCVLLVALIIAVSALAWHGSIGGEAVVGFFTGITGLIGGAAANSHGVKQGSQAATDPPAEG